MELAHVSVVKISIKYLIKWDKKKIGYIWNGIKRERDGNKSTCVSIAEIDNRDVSRVDT